MNHNINPMVLGPNISISQTNIDEILKNLRKKIGQNF